jgi:Domain of unknown function (DUF4148)
MKSLRIAIFVVASAAALPSVSFAQSTSGPLTRAQVRAQLVDAEQQGQLHQSNARYPRTAAIQHEGESAGTASFMGTTAFGSATHARGSLYAHH